MPSVVPTASREGSARSKASSGGLVTHRERQQAKQTEATQLLALLALRNSATALLKSANPLGFGPRGLECGSRRR
jgi:hypothetical protein